MRQFWNLVSELRRPGTPLALPDFLLSCQLRGSPSPRRSARLRTKRSHAPKRGKSILTRGNHPVLDSGVIRGDRIVLPCILLPRFLRVCVVFMSGHLVYRERYRER